MGGSKQASNTYLFVNTNTTHFAYTNHILTQIQKKSTA